MLRVRLADSAAGTAPQAHTARMLITLFTDASYCSRSRVAAYAAWAKADGRTVRHSGVLKQPVPNSSLAETMALVNGIHVAIAAMRPPAASKIIAQTDCLAAIQALSGLLRRAQAIRQYEAVVAAYRERSPHRASSWNSAMSAATRAPSRRAMPSIPGATGNAAG